MGAKLLGGGWDPSGRRRLVPAWAAAGLPEPQAGVRRRAARSFPSLSKLSTCWLLPVTPRSWPSLAGLFGMAGPDSPSVRLPPRPRLFDSHSPPSSHSGSVACQQCALSDTLPPAHLLCAEKPPNAGGLVPSSPSIFPEPEAFLSLSNSTCRPGAPETWGRRVHS